MPQEKRLYSSDSEAGEDDYKPSKKQASSSKKVESSEDESDISESLDDESSEEEGEKPKRVKKQASKVKKITEKKADVSRNAEGDQIFPLSAKRRVTVRSFPNGGAAIDIRETYMDKNGEERPGKGICLPLDQWKKLTAFLPDIEEAIAALPNKKK